MWLFNSSIGRKLVMSITGACLILFVTFHVLMNSVALIWPVAYNQVCEFLGANWYALIASAGLAFLFIIHIAYATWLTLQNRKARGNDRYAVTSRPPQVEWASKNMLVLGIVILAFLVVHLIQFWAKMQWQELRHAELAVLPQLQGGVVLPAQGTLFLQIAFSEVWTPIVYIIGFVALWFHMNHGFWSMFQSAGWNNQNWLPRLKKIGCWWTTIVVALFVAQAIVFTVHAANKYYLTDENLKEQYAENISELCEPITTSLSNELNAFNEEVQQYMHNGGDMAQVQQMQKAFLENKAIDFLKKADVLVKTYNAHCAGIAAPAEYSKLENLYTQFKSACTQFGVQLPAELNPAATQPQTK